MIAGVPDSFISATSMGFMTDMTVPFFPFMDCARR